MTEIEIGKAKRARRAYSFDDIAIVPSRRTRDPEEVSVAWQIDAYRFELPILAAPMDSVMSPETAIALGKYGGLGVLNLEGLWTRYEEPEPLLAEVAELQGIEATQRLQEIYAEPIKPELISARLKEIRDAGVTVAGSLSPQRTKQFAKTVVDAGVDMFVIRGTTVSAEHVSSQAEPLNLKEFIYELDVPVIVGGCATYQAALHLMRTGAAGVLVGFGGGAAHTTRTVLGRRRTHGERGRRRGRGPPRLHGRVGRSLRPRDRRRFHRQVRRHRQGRRVRRRRGDGRLAVRARHRRTRPRLPLGCRGTPPVAARAASASRSAPSAPSRRSCSARPAWPTAP